MFDDFFKFIQESFPGRESIGLHEPIFIGNEKKYLNECIDTTLVSSVGPFVNLFEKNLSEYTGSRFTVATSNGTSALHAALHLVGVKPGDRVLIPALTFIATANAVMYCGAEPVFIDSESATLGMCPEKLEDYLKKNQNGSRVAACVPMHVFGHPVKLNEILEVCARYNVPVVEDAAESLGSTYHDKHTGLLGRIGVLSFNGNKIITTGGGGALLIQDEALAKRAKHVTTTAKIPHAWEFIHDEVGFNYRLPNLNAALGCAQLEHLPQFLQNKRELAQSYIQFFSKKGIEVIQEPKASQSNYWLNAIKLKNLNEQQQFLEESKKKNIACRPIWKLMTDLKMYKDCERTDLSQAQDWQSRVVCLPSGVRL